MHNKLPIRYNLLLLLIVLFFVEGVNSHLSAQQKTTTKITIKSADYSWLGTQGKPTRFVGNVHMVQDNLLMWCDSLYHYESADSSYIEAFGNVRAIQNDSIHLSGDYMHYDGYSKLAQVRDNVMLRDPQMTLTTNFLDYDGVFEFGFYYNGGTLVDNTNTLKSQRGHYFTKSKVALFREDVSVDSPEYMIYSDTLRYNTEDKIVSILGPTDIIGKGEENNTVYSEDGWYDTTIGHAELYKNNLVTHLDYTIKANKIVVDSISQQAFLYNDITIHDTINKVIVKGDYAEADNYKKMTFVTKEALLILVGDKDSLFLHCDTLRFHQDSSRNSIIKGYYGTRFFSRDLQGVCDSMIYTAYDSTVTLYHEPIVWASGNQMRGTTIDMTMSNNEPKEFHLNDNATMISRRDTSEMYDQIKGKNITGYFRDKELFMVYIEGAGETIYYPDDKGIIIGLNTAESPNIRIKLKDRKITDITFLRKTDGSLNPLFLSDPLEARLKDFTWMESLRPVDKYDIFNRVRDSEKTEQELVNPKAAEPEESDAAVQEESKEESD